MPSPVAHKNSPTRQTRPATRSVCLTCGPLNLTSPLLRLSFHCQRPLPPAPRHHRRAISKTHAQTSLLPPPPIPPPSPPHLRNLLSATSPEGTRAPATRAALRLRPALHRRRGIRYGPVPRARSDAYLRPRFSSLPNPIPRPITFILAFLFSVQVATPALQSMPSPPRHHPRPLLHKVRVGFSSSSQLLAPRVPPLDFLQMRN